MDNKDTPLFDLELTAPFTGVFYNSKQDVFGTTRTDLKTTNIELRKHLEKMEKDMRSIDIEKIIKLHSFKTFVKNISLGKKEEVLVVPVEALLEELEKENN